MSSDEATQSASSKTPPAESSTGSDPPQFKVFNPPVNKGILHERADLPDDYFELTKTELKAAFDSQRKLRESLVDAPLKTQSMRQAEEKRKLQRWPTATIRVKFPDQTILEKRFGSSEKIKAIYAFVRESIREDMKPNKFILYQTPPRREFKVSDPAVRDLTLAQLSLAPSSILYLSFLDANLNNPALRAPLVEEILRLAEDLPLPPSVDLTPSNSVQTGVSKKEDKGKGSSGEKKIPKWLKLGKK